MKKNSFVEGTIIATLAIVFTKILGMLYVIPFYSIIGTEGSALYSYAYNIYLIFLSISSAGIPNAMSKIVSEYDTLGMKDAKVRSFKIGILIISFLSVISFLILIFFSETIAYLIVGDVTGGNSIEDITMVIFVVSFSVLIIPFLSVARGYLQGHQYIKPSSNSQMIEQIVRIVVILSGSYVSIKLMHLSVSVGVSIAVSGAFIGGLVAIFYIIKKIYDNKNTLDLDKNKTIKKDAITNKIILKKIASYAIPFIIINLTVNVYNTVDMTLILQTLAKLGYDGATSEFIAGVVTTWGYKLNMIVNSFATGLSISLIPSIVACFSLKKYHQLNGIFNKALQIVLFISIPAAVGLSFLAHPVWVTFYGLNEYGPIVFKMTILTSIFCNFYMISIQAAQSLSLYKKVYIGVIAGFVTNALLDVPMMYLCNFIGIPPYYGASFATIIGYIIAIVIILLEIKKIEEISYKDTWKTLSKILFAIVIMLIVLFIMQLFIDIYTTTRFSSIIVIAIYSIVGASIYLYLTYKMGIITKLFSKERIDKLFKFLSFGKYKGGK